MVQINSGFICLVLLMTDRQTVYLSINPPPPSIYIYLSISIYPSLSIYQPPPSLYLSIPSIHPSRLSIYLFTHPSLLFIHSSIYIPSLYSSIYSISIVSIHLSISILSTHPFSLSLPILSLTVCRFDYPLQACLHHFEALCGMQDAL